MAPPAPDIDILSPSVPPGDHACLRLPTPEGLTHHWLTSLLISGSQFVGKPFPVIINPSCIRVGYTKGLRIAQTILKEENKIRDSTLPDFQRYHKDIVIKIVWYCHTY